MTILDILQGAPRWVWPLLAVLVALGLSQAMPRRVTLRRALLPALVLAGLSLAAVAAALPGQALGLLAWAAGAAAALLASIHWGLWSGVTSHADGQRLEVPGSWLPLLLMLAIFAARFAVGALLATRPALAQLPTFAAGVGLVYGAFSGLFAARARAAWSAWRGAMRPAMA